MRSNLEKNKRRKKAIMNENPTIDKIFDISTKIDEENLFLEKFNEYDKIIKNTESRELINNIKKDLFKHYYNISEQQVTVIALNIFDYSYLKVQNVAEEDILRYICTKNMIYNDMLTNKDKKAMRLDLNVKYFSYLIEKYIKKLLENK